MAARGLYNGLVLLGDYETGSYWDHITGECRHGRLAGHRLYDFPLQQSTAGQAAAVAAAIRIAVSGQSLLHRLISWMMESQRLRTSRGLPPRFARTMAQEDARRPRMERGLGVWTERTARYYPLDAIRTARGVLIDSLGGRSLLVYLDPATSVPSAIWSQANQALWEGKAPHMDRGQTIENGLLHDGEHSRPPHGPMQIFTRWYGFAFTFPNCEIYGGKKAERNG